LAFQLSLDDRFQPTFPAAVCITDSRIFLTLWATERILL